MCIRDSRGGRFAQSNFQRADLTGAQCAGADLQQCIFHDARCGGATFVDADLTYADLARADLSGADLRGATLFRARLHRVNESGTLFSSSRALALGDDRELAEAETWQPLRTRGP